MRVSIKKRGLIGLLFFIYILWDPELIIEDHSGKYSFSEFLGCIIMHLKINCVQGLD